VKVRNHVDGPLGVLAGFHIHANEVIQPGRAPHELLDVGAALVVGEIEAELGQLERDVALNAGIVNSGKSVEYTSRASAASSSEVTLSPR